MALKHYLEIMRPGNCIMAAIAVFIGYAVAIGGIGFSIPLALAMLSAFLICGAGQAINDYFDREIDKKINALKPIPSGEIKPTNALIFSITLFIIGTMISSAINFDALLIALAFSILLIIYSALMQKYKFIGNWIVALGTAFTLIYGAAVIGDYSVVVFLAASALFANAGREITKDIEDLAADRGYKKSLPMILPPMHVKVFVLILYAIGMGIGFYVWVAGLMQGILYIALILGSSLAFFQSYRLLYREMHGESQKYSKWAMLIALIAYLAGVL